MGINHIKSVMRVLYRARIPLFLFGAHGIGKTSAAYQLYLELAAERGQNPRLDKGVVFAHKRLENNAVDVDLTSLSTLDGRALARSHEDLDGFGFWAISATNITTEEFVGMPDVEDRGSVYREVYLRTLAAAAQGRDDEAQIAGLHKRLLSRACGDLRINAVDERRVLRYLRMNALMPAPEHRGGGIWVLDELNLGFPEVERAGMQILLEGRYLDYVLPPGVWIVVTMNPPCSEYPQARDLALPTMDRGAMLCVDVDKGEWLHWAQRRGLSELSRLYVDKHDGLLNKVKPNFEALDNPGTYRSIELVDRAFEVMSDKEKGSEVGLSVAVSLLGREAGTVYFRESTEHVHRPLSVDDVVDDYGWRKTMSEDEVRDHESWKMTKSRSRLLAMIRKENVKVELVRYTLMELEKWLGAKHENLRSRGSTKTNPLHTVEERGQLLNLLVFLLDLPADVSRGFLVDSVDEKFVDLLWWAGRYPVAKAFYKKIERDFKLAGGEA